MSTSILINTTNFFGQEADITFYPCSGGTLNLGLQLLPYTYVTLDDNYSGTYDLSFTALSAFCSFSIPCGSPPIVNYCYPMFATSANTVYYFDFTGLTENYYYNFIHPMSAMTRDDNYLWVYDGTNTIYEYDVGTMTPPALLRQINTSINSVDIYGLYPYTSSTKLVASNTTNDVYVVDISTTTASKTTLFSHAGTNQPCNILRDENIGLTYLKDGSSIKSYYDDGTLYSTSTPTGDTKGIFRDPSNAKIYVINSSGETYNIPQSSGTVTPTYYSTIPLTTDLNVGVAQSSSCISPLTSFSLRAGTGTTGKGLTGTTTFTITANTGTFNWIDWGDGSYYSNGEGSIVKSHYYFTGTPYSGNVTVYSYTDFSGLTGLFVGSNPSSVAPGIFYQDNGRFYISEMNKITGLERLVWATIFNQFTPQGSLSLFPPNLNYVDNSFNPAYGYPAGFTSGFTQDLPASLEYIRWTGGNLIGDVSNLPSGLIEMYITQSSFTGLTNNLPSTIKNFQATNGSDKISGDTSGFPSGMDAIVLTSTNGNRISGDLSGLPKVSSSVTFGKLEGSSILTGPGIDIRGLNTISGNTSGLTGGYPKYFILGGNNTITGSLSGFPNTVTILNISGQNTLSGCLSELTLTGSNININITGSNTLSCDGTGLPSGIAILSLDGAFMSVSGDISTYSGTSVPTTMVIRGINTITGDISGIWTGISTLDLYGNNTVTGDIANLPNSAPITNRNFEIDGQNTIYGDIANLPSTHTDFRCYGDNIISGNVANIPAQVRYLDIRGDNTIGGAISGINSTNLRTFILTSSATTLTGPVTGISLPSSYNTFTYRPIAPAVGLTQTDVDDLLCYFTGLTFGSGTKYIDLTGTNAAPSATGIACKAILTGNSVNVQIN